MNAHIENKKCMEFPRTPFWGKGWVEEYVLRVLTGPGVDRKARGGEDE
jgi:hypothetical protein